MNIPHTKRVGLLFNGHQSFYREVIGGIGAYLQSTRVVWDLFLEEDFRLRLAGIENWAGDGIIADFDDPAVAAALSRCKLPVVAVGGSYAADSAYPAGVPYVATDNHELIKLAHRHLIDVGVHRFAMFSQPEASECRWALERENAFRSLMLEAGMEAVIYRGRKPSASCCNDGLQDQIAWLHSLPKPVGIIGVTDARICQLLRACIVAGIAVPEQVALIGIDDDPLVRQLTQIPLSSVIQGAHEIGRTAAQLLDQMLRGVQLMHTRILVPPAGINAFGSSRHLAVKHPYVMRARHFIRQYACQGIKTDQVAEHVGVSRSSLEAYFRTEMGCSVHDAILRFKLDAAMAGLVENDRSIADVALACGFTTAQYMYLVFKRELGCTPRAYRNRVRGGAAVAVHHG